MKPSLALLGVLLASASFGGCVSRAQTPPAPVANRATVLLRDFAGARYFWQQAEVGEKLVALGDKSVIPALLPWLDAPERARRINAGRVLAGLGEERGFFAVLQELNDSGPRAVPAGGPINSHGQPDVIRQTRQDRHYAAGVLGKMGDERATPALIALLHDPNLDYQAALALAELGDKWAIEPLIAALKRAPAENYSPNTDIQIYAGAALMALGNAQGLPALSQIMRSNPHGLARRNAADLLGAYGDAGATPILVEALRDESLAVRVTAITSLGAVGDGRALPALRKARLDKDPAKGNVRLDARARSTQFEWLTPAQAAAKAMAQIESRQTKERARGQLS